MRLIVTPGTILRWQRDIVRRRWARLSRRGRSGCPATHRKVRLVVLQMALATIRADVIAALKDAGYLHIPEGRRDDTTPAETLRLHDLD